MILEPIKSKRIYESIVAQIKNLLAAGSLKPGDKLPTERELAQSFRVSRASVREALRALEFMGLVESRPGGGTYVKEATLDFLVEHLASMITLRRGSLLEVFEVRKILEPKIAALAAERITDEDLRQLEEILERERREIESGRTGVDADTEFHFTLATAAQNRVILRLVDAIVDLLKETREESLQVKGRPQAAYENHLRILQAVKARDRRGAERARLDHLKAVERVIFAKLKDAPAQR
ncbi:MAG: FadR family transcriptional regulator [Deltaproteobacteria bacterium]|nr:FadR family transcriptional regulator [Deltaproteobacteria bacterium]